MKHRTRTGSKRRSPTAPAGRSAEHHVPSFPLLAPLFAALAITFAVYAGSLDHEFLSWDDQGYVTENPLVRNRDYGTLLRAIVSNNYHPLTMLSLAANAAPPLSPRPFLVTNALLHTFNTGLVFWLALLLAGRRVFPAFWAALFFGIHPMHVESVAWIAERKDVLYTAFFLGGLIAYWRYLERTRARWLGLAFVLFVLSCLSKGMAVVFPLALVLVDLWRRRPVLERRAIVEKVPFLAVSLLFGLIAVDVQAGGDFHGLLARTNVQLKGLADSLPHPSWQRAILPAYGFGLYVARILAPMELSAFHAYPSPVEVSSPRFLLAPILLLASLALLVWDLRRTRIVTFGLGWLVVTLAPVLQWIPVGEAIVADRYSYLSYVGPLFAIGMWAELLAARARALRAATTAVLTALAGFFLLQTARQVETWRSDEALWTNAIERDPRNEMAYVARGNARGASGRIADALSDLRRARALGSSRATLYDGLGNAYTAIGKLDSALVWYTAGLEGAPNMGRLYYNRAVAYLRLGRPSEALADLQRARALVPPQTLDFHAPFADAYLKMRRYPEARAEYDRAIAAGRRDPNIFYNRAVARWNLGDSAGAAADYEEARRLYGLRGVPPPQGGDRR